MMTEMESLLNRLDYHKDRLNWLRDWDARIEEDYARDFDLCDEAMKNTEAAIDELEQVIAIERIVQLCLTGK